MIQDFLRRELARLEESLHDKTDKRVFEESVRNKADRGALAAYANKSDVRMIVNGVVNSNSPMPDRTEIVDRDVMAAQLEREEMERLRKEEGERSKERSFQMMQSDMIKLKANMNRLMAVINAAAGLPAVPPLDLPSNNASAAKTVTPSPLPQGEGPLSSRRVMTEEQRRKLAVDRLASGSRRYCQ